MQIVGKDKAAAGFSGNRISWEVIMAKTARATKYGTDALYVDGMMTLVEFVESENGIQYRRNKNSFGGMTKWQETKAEPYQLSSAPLPKNFRLPR
jgi:hypothetical protein